MVHAGEVQQREAFGEEECKFIFGQPCLSLVKEPLNAWDPRYNKVIFLGYAPNVTSGHYVLHENGQIEVSANVKKMMDLETLDKPETHLPQQNA